MQDVYKRLVKGLALIPPKYYLGAAGAVILLLCYGIAKTVVTPVTVPAEIKAETAKPAAALVPPQTPATIPPAIAEGNLFRKQRKDFSPPKNTLAETGDEPVPDIKLVGLIITDQRRLAIVDAEVKKYFKREVAPDLVISGLKQAQPAEDGRFYEVVALPGKGEKLASQTFNEGDIIASYRLDRVNDTFIEVSSLASGKRTSIYLMEADEAAASLEARAKHVKAVPLRGPDISMRGSGAVTP